MVGGCLSCFFTSTSVLLLGLCLQDVQTSSCDRDIHKKVGDTVELASCSPAEGVTSAEWKYGSSLIADKTIPSVNSQFKGRLEINATSFHLTVRRLTLQDSGKFSFISAVNDQQRKTVTITLHVHEPITIAPTVTYNSSWHASTNSCTVWLDCSASAGSSVTYSWAVRNQTSPGLQGSRRHYNISPQDGDTRFTCFISNVVTEKSASVTVKCSSTHDPRDSGLYVVVILCAAGGGFLIIVIIVGAAVYVCNRKKSQAGSDSNDLTVYADIADVAIGRRTSSAMKPCTLYETIENKVNTVTPGPHTVYDQIQFNRMREASVSPYQEVS